MAALLEIVRKKAS